MSELRTLVIRSSEWLRGTGGKNSRMKKGDKYCCLGLDARDLGIERLDTTSPMRLVPIDRDKMNHWINETGTNNHHCTEAMRVNDDTDTNDEEKITLLRPIFRKVGIEIDWRPNE